MCSRSLSVTDLLYFVGKVYRDASNFRRIRVPLTDFPFGVAMINRLANSVQVREKSLKCCQYVFRAIAYSDYLGAAECSKSPNQRLHPALHTALLISFQRTPEHPVASGHPTEYCRQPRAR